MIINSRQFILVVFSWSRSSGNYCKLLADKAYEGILDGGKNVSHKLCFNGFLLNDISQSFPVHPGNGKQKYDACVTNSSSPKRICIVMVICFPGCFPSAVTHPACSSSLHESVLLVQCALSFLLAVGLIVLKYCRAPEVSNTIAWLKPLLI